MTDSVDNKLIAGILNVRKFDDNNNISGNYSIKNRYNTSFLGYTTMRGSFDGKVDEKKKTAFINTNPKIADNNIFFYLDIVDDSIKGKWNYVTINGVANWGKIFGVKKKY